MYNCGFDEKDLCFDPEYAQEILDEASNNEYANLKEDIDTLINMSVKVFGSALTDRELFDAIFKLYDVQEWDIDFADDEYIFLCNDLWVNDEKIPKLGYEGEIDFKGHYSYSDDFLDYSGDYDAETREYSFSEAMYEIVLAMLLNKYKTKVLKVYNKR